jgi:plasmid maintenance system antidote protein VapI
LGTSVAFWLNLQANFDAWHAERDPAVRKITPLSRRP